ncbi:hypothetical protein OAG84_04870 [Akkermansiaceae bacterium]|nr:hypothetical protein [Akkermansiaceae bacterium]
MRLLSLSLTLLILTGCKDNQSASTPPEAPTEAPVAHLKEEHVTPDFANLLAPLIDPARLDTLKGKRAATPRLRKACYWLQIAHTNGFDIGEDHRPFTRLSRPRRPTESQSPTCIPYPESVNP